MPLRFRILSSPPARPPEGRTALTAGEAPGPIEERTFELAADGAEVRLGRQPTCEIELPFPAVSVFHARLFRGESAHEWWLEDQGSTNGTWLDGQRLAPRRPAPIRAGQRLRVGSVDIVFEGWAAAVKGDESTATIARRLISDLFSGPGADVPELALEEGRAAPACLRLVDRDRRYVAGRGDACALVIAGGLASREHAAFERRWDGVFVIDLGSRNGVLVNGAAIAGPRRLRDGDRIQLGGVALRLGDPEDRYLRRLEAAGEGGADARVGLSPAPELSPGRTDLPRPAAASPGGAAGPAPAPAVRAPGQAGRLSLRRKLAMAVAAGILLAAVASLIALLAG